jgi:O-antigen/teichoic acid export membrane protein
VFRKVKLKMSGDKHLNELIKGGAASFLVKITGMLISYFVLLYITNNFGAEAFGNYTIAVTVLSIATLLPKFGMGSSLVRIVGELYTNNKLATIRSVVNRSIVFCLVISVIVSGVLFYTAQDIANYMNQPQAVLSIRWMSMAITPAAILAILAATFQAMRKVVEFSLLTSVLVPLLFLLGMIISFEKLDVIPVYVYAVYSSLVVGCIVYKFSFSATGEYTLTVYPFKRIIQISFPMLLSGSIFLIMSWTDILMLMYFKGEEAVGIYSAAQRMAAITSISLVAINSISTPKYIQLYTTRNFEGLASIAKQSARFIFFASAPLLLIFLLFPKFILGFFGDEFIVGYVVLILLTIAQFVNSISGSVGCILQMTDNQDTFKNIILLAAIINVILNYFLIPLYGINGAAFSSMISIIFWNVTMVFYVKIKLGFYTIYFPFLANLR